MAFFALSLIFVPEKACCPAHSGLHHLSNELTVHFQHVIIGYPLSGSNSVVECDLAKVEVAGSTPVSRSIFLLAVASRPGAGLCSQGQQGGHSVQGAVPKW